MKTCFSKCHPERSELGRSAAKFAKSKDPKAPRTDNGKLRRSHESVEKMPLSCICNVEHRRGPSTRAGALAQDGTLVRDCSPTAAQGPMASVLYCDFPNMKSGSSVLSRRFAPLTLLLLLAFPLLAQEAGKPEIQLVEKVLARIGGPSAISLSVSNVSSLSASQAETIRRELERQFRLHGVRIVPPEQSVVSIVVTLSENPRGSLWIGEIIEGQTRDVIIQPVAVISADSPSRSDYPFTLQLRLVFSADYPVLDFAELADHQVLALFTDRLVLYSSQQGKMLPSQQMPLELIMRSRDPRGRLTVNGTNFEVSLPGYRCYGTAAGTISANCQQSDDPWPLLPQNPSQRAFYANARNFFTGVITGAGSDRSANAFYNAAAYHAPEGDHFFLSGVDGRQQLETGTVARVNGAQIGTEVATIKADCSDAWLVLGSRASDWTKTDAVQLFTLSGSDLQSASREMDLSGPVTAMWSAAPSQVNVVVRNLRTGSYEAYAFSIACTR
jgi:hypothetical protein